MHDLPDDPGTYPDPLLAGAFYLFYLACLLVLFSLFLTYARWAFRALRTYLKGRTR